jgi:hypothetical protein
MNEHSWTSEAKWYNVNLKNSKESLESLFWFEVFHERNENHLSGGWIFLMTEMVLEEMRFGEEGAEGMHVTWIFALQTQCEGCNESIYELLGGWSCWGKNENVSLFPKAWAHWKCFFCKLCQYLNWMHLNQPQAPLSLVVTPWEGNFSTPLTEQYEQNAKLPHLKDLLQTYFISNGHGNARM